jgi:hypothetical protein
MTTSDTATMTGDIAMIVLSRGPNPEKSRAEPSSSPLRSWLPSQGQRTNSIRKSLSTRRMETSFEIRDWGLLPDLNSGLNTKSQRT